VLLSEHVSAPSGEYGVYINPNPSPSFHLRNNIEIQQSMQLLIDLWCISYAWEQHSLALKVG